MLREVRFQRLHFELKNGEIFVGGSHCTVVRRGSSAQTIAPTKISLPLLYRNINPQNMAVVDILTNVPQVAVLSFAGIGFLYISSKIVSYVYLLLDMFVLSGTPVSSP
jgi:hypothetical protein